MVRDTPCSPSLPTMSKASSVKCSACVNSSQHKIEPHHQMSLFNLFQRKEQPSLFSGGNGESLETAVIVDMDDSFAGVQAEYPPIHV